ncbi:uncharacterized protein LOC126885477, partial [Diabrotica virgifera virgifera]|uniref:MADF domain-containing protein n=1 Tax=Diabrotica virgifera virgifera TaxID=50390 RepID=A0ABM5KCT8_DIAVI
FPANSVKDQWRKLRDSYREALRRQQTKSGQKSVQVRLWIYQKQMEFLKPYMKNRATVGWPEVQQSEEIQSEQTEAQSEQTETQSEQTETQSEQTADITVPNDEGPNEAEEIECVQPQKKRKTAVSRIDPIKRYINNSEQRAKRRDEERSLLLQLSQGERQSQQNDPLYHFFMSMYKITKNLPKIYQRQIRRNLFDDVSKAEEDSESGSTCSIRSDNAYSFSPNTSYSSTPEPCCGSTLRQAHPEYLRQQHPDDGAGTSQM